jgi:hypothetical protein
MHGKSDEDFGHGTLLPNYGACTFCEYQRRGVKHRGLAERSCISRSERSRGMI